MGDGSKMQGTRGEELPEECPEGFEYRELRAYVRSDAEGVPVPPGVLAHVDDCRVCHPKWEFLRRSDPIVKKQFDSRVLSFAEQVTIQEIVFRPRVSAAAAGNVGVSRQVQAVIATPARLTAAASLLQEPGMDRILDTRVPLEPIWVVDIFDRVRSIPDETERQRKGETVAALFEDRLKEKKISRQRIFETLSKLTLSPQKQVVADEMIEVVAIIPETAYASNPPLLTLEAGHAIFDAPHFQRLRGMVPAY